MENKGKENTGLESIKGMFDEFNEKFPRPKKSGDAHEGGGYITLRVVKTKILKMTKKL